ERVLNGEMPPPKHRKPSAEQIARIREWVVSGAKAEHPDAIPTPISLVSDSDRQFWSFRPLARPVGPSVGGLTRARTPIDRFLLARLESKGLAFSSDTDPVTLVRRVSLDLIGLPPSPDEVNAYLADSAPGAYERLVDRLLASPHFGERWGRHWLD